MMIMGNVLIKIANEHCSKKHQTDDNEYDEITDEDSSKERDEESNRGDKKAEK